MQITIEVADPKADFVLELLKNLPFVTIQTAQLRTDSTEEEEIRSLSPKTAQLLGSFPQLTSYDDQHVRQLAIQNKQLR